MDVTSHPFFADVNPKELDRILERTQLEEYTSEQVIFEEGSSSDALYLILEGKVSFQKQVGGSDWLTVNQGEAGTYFGEIGVLTGEPRALRAVALNEVRVLYVPGDALRGFLRNISHPVEKLLQSVVQHLDRTTGHFIEERLHQEKMAMVGSMVNSIVHDFKNPFCVISLSAELLRQKISNPDLYYLCDNIMGQVKRMVEMASELSEYSRGESSLVKTPVCLQQLMQQFKANNFPFFEHKRVKLEVDVPRIQLQASESKLLRVFQNLVGNAIDAFGVNGGQIRISAKKQAAENQVEVRIEDNAGGIPEEIRDRFFEPFVTHGKREGTGLGTAICKSVVEAHGGRIGFETETGKGTCFIIHLPL
ncbi:MAG: cyclic nucleotide-binding domain-containing protein [Opitutales bacterium]|nr:cyclic nucleotide-binding domain-containing protein [Opitutales bacterium]